MVLLAVCTLGSSRWFGRETSRVEIVELLVGGQTLMHGVMTAVAGPHGHHGHPEPGPDTVGGAVANAVEHLVGELTPAHAPMMLAHLAAAVITGLWLARGERALWDLIRLIAHVTRLAIFVLILPVAPIIGLSIRRPPVARSRVVASLRQVFLFATHVRRGPPVDCCAL